MKWWDWGRQNWQDDEDDPDEDDRIERLAKAQLRAETGTLDEDELESFVSWSDASYLRYWFNLASPR